jgi:phage-related protein
MKNLEFEPLSFIGSARKDLRAFPQKVRQRTGLDLMKVQAGLTPDSAKPLKGFRGVMELIERSAKDTYRAVYVANLGARIYVLHCFKKKSKRGIKTPPEDIEVIRQRLKTAQALEAEKGKKR